MTTAEYISKLDRQLSAIEDAKFLLPCVGAAHARQVERVFTNGINALGAKIGQYNSSDPIYVNPNSSPKGFPTTGKTGSDTFKDGRKHKTGYFDSYKAFRQAISRETGFVNLRLTEDLKIDFTNSLTLSGNVYQTGVRKKTNADKVDGIADKYGPETWALTADEIETYKDCVRRKLYDTLNN